MKPTHEQLQAFVGGQMEIQNDAEGYLFRGEIRAIAFQGEDFYVRFKWFAKKGGTPQPPPLYGDKWVKEDKLDYELSVLDGFTHFQESPGSPGDTHGRIIIQSVISGELCVLYHPTAERKLDPASVEGLAL
jgi:hypothetical protein